MNYYDVLSWMMEVNKHDIRVIKEINAYNYGNNLNGFSNYTLLSYFSNHYFNRVLLF